MVRRYCLLCLLLLSIVLSACDLPKVEPRSSPLKSNGETTYTVQSGDTLSKIALQFHSTVEQLVSLNRDQYPGLAQDPSHLQVGWNLRVPTGGTLDQGTSAIGGEFQNLDLNKTAQLIVERLNVSRGQSGLVLLRSDLVLTRIAHDRSADMVARGYFSHHDPETGQEPLLQNLKASGFVYQFAGENLAELKNDVGWVPPLLTVASRYNSLDLADEFVRGWLASPEHRDNVLNSHYRRTGVAIAIDGDGRRIVATQVFSD